MEEHLQTQLTSEYLVSVPSVGLEKMCCAFVIGRVVVAASGTGEKLDEESS